MDALYLNIKDVRLDYRKGQAGALYQIRLTSNKVKEMKGNGLLTEGILETVTSIFLIKSNKELEIQVESLYVKVKMKKNDTELAKLVLKYPAMDSALGDFLVVSPNYTRAGVTKSLEMDVGKNRGGVIK